MYNTLKQDDITRQDSQAVKVLDTYFKHRLSSPTFSAKLGNDRLLIEDIDGYCKVIQ